MKVNIEKQADGTYMAYNTTGDEVTLIGTGDTVSEARADFFNSVNEVKADYEEGGGDVPACLCEEVEFKFDLSSLFEYYKMLNVSALGRYMGINDSLMRQYKKGDTPISDVQLKKIESGLHRFADELAALKLV